MISASPTSRGEDTVQQRERGQATLEQVGLIGAVVVLLAAVAASLGSGGGGAQLASAIGTRLVEAAGMSGASSTSASASVSLGSAHVHASHSVGVVTGTGSHKPHLTDLQMHDLGPQLAWHSWSTNHDWTTLPSGQHLPANMRYQLPGAAANANGSLCVLCAGATGRAEYALGGTSHGRGDGLSSGDLLGVDALVRSHAALVHAVAATSMSLQAFGVHASTRLTATGTAGLDASLATQLQLGALHQSLALEAGAVAGLAGHVEQRASVNLAGVALHGTAGADGWLGAGLTGHLHLGHDGKGKFSWDAGGGAGLGVGGGAHVSGAIDLSQAMHAHPHVVADVLGGSLFGLSGGAAGPGLAALAIQASGIHH